MMATVSEDAGMTAPTEMSSSPAIISRPTGRATMPISDAILSQLDQPAADKNCPPPVTAKNRNTASIPRNDPASGRRAILPSATPRPGGPVSAASEEATGLGVIEISMRVQPPQGLQPFGGAAA